MPRLTKAIREDLAKKIFAATNFPDLKAQIKKDFYAASTLWAKSFLPPDFNDSIKNLPREWFATCSSYELRGAVNPLNCMKPLNERHSYSHTVPLEAFACPVRMVVTPPGQDDAGSVVQEWLKVLIKRAENWFDESEKFKAELDSTLWAYNTTEKLLKDFPQFAKHITIPQKTYPVAVAPGKFSALLTASGFDKTEA